MSGIGPVCALEVYLEPLLGGSNALTVEAKPHSGDAQARELVEAHVAALGGRERLEAVCSVRMWGTVRIGDGPAMPLVIEKVVPGAMRSVTQTPAGFLTEVAAGGGAWLQEPGQPVVESSLERARELAVDALIFGLLPEWERFGLALESNGRDPETGWDELEIRTPVGGRYLFWLDPDTHLLRRTAQGVMHEGQPRVYTAEVLAYRDVDGVSFPAHLKVSIQGIFEGEVEFTGMTLNPGDITKFWGDFAAAVDAGASAP